MIPESSRSSLAVRGPRESLCGVLGVLVNDQINGGRGAVCEDSKKRLRAIFSFHKVGNRRWENYQGPCSSGEMVSPAPRQSLVTPQDIKSAKRRRSAKPDVWATSFDIRNHACPRPNKETGWRSRPKLPDQYSPAVHAGQIQWVRRARQFAELQLTFPSIPLRERRFVAHADCSSWDIQSGSCASFLKRQTVQKVCDWLHQVVSDKIQ